MHQCTVLLCVRRFKRCSQITELYLTIAIHAHLEGGRHVKAQQTNHRLCSGLQTMICPLWANLVKRLTHKLLFFMRFSSFTSSFAVSDHTSSLKRDLTSLSRWGAEVQIIITKAADNNHAEPQQYWSVSCSLCYLELSITQQFAVLWQIQPVGKSTMNKRFENHWARSNRSKRKDTNLSDFDPSLHYSNIKCADLGALLVDGILLPALNGCREMLVKKFHHVWTMTVM